MSDSLVVGNVIELLGGGAVSDHPLCAGAMFRLAPGWDLSAPQPSTGTVASLLLGGGLPIGQHVDNRTPSLPIVIQVPPSGQGIAVDRLTLAGAREVLLQTVNADRWQLVWTRDSGLPMILDCFHAHPAVVTYSEPSDWGLIARITVSFDALPYGRSDTLESIAFSSPAVGWTAPPSPVVLDNYSTIANWLQGDDAGFNGGTLGNWVAGANTALAPSSAQAHSGTGSMLATASGAGQVNALSNGVPANSLPVLPGDTVHAGIWSRPNTTARSFNAAVDFYQSDGVTLISTLAGSNATEVAATWVQATATVTAPALAAFAVLHPQVLAAGAGEGHFLDDPNLDRGPIQTSTNVASFTQGSSGAIGGNCLRWSRQAHSCPLYTTQVPAVDITGRNKLSVWIGLGTGTYSQWHTGKAWCSVTLTDATGNQVTVTIPFTAVASNLSSVPRWQKISGLIPQNVTFDWTTVSGYAIKLWNKIEPGKVSVLQAEAYFDTLRADPTSTGTYGARGTVYSIPGAVGTAPAPLSLQLQPGPSAAPSTAVFNVTTGSNNWTAPTGITLVSIAEVWGAGGGGGFGIANRNGGGGGAGGEYAKDYNIPVTPATVYHPFVPAPGSGGTSGSHSGGNGQNATFTGDSGRTVIAHGGQGGGQKVSTNGGQGGTGSTAPVHYDGGDGANPSQYGNTFPGGGGGSSGGTGQAGDDGGGGTQHIPGTAPVGGGPGGDGGHQVTTPHTGSVPSSGPGGGGGGGAVLLDGSAYNGAAGFKGQVRLTWGGTIPTLKTAVIHLPPRDAPNSLAPLIAAGNGTDVPNGATWYSAPLTGNLQARYRGTYQAVLTVQAWNTPASSRTVTVTIRQTRGDGTTVTTSLARTITPNTDPDPLHPGTQGLLLLGTVTLPLTPATPGNNTDVIACSVNDTNTSDRFYDLLLLDTTGQTLIYSSSGAGVNNLWVTEPDIGIDLAGVYGSNVDWDVADSLLADCPVMAGGPLAVVPGENPVLVYSVQGAPGIIASYQPRWHLDRLS